VTPKLQICPKFGREGNAQSAAGVEREAIERVSSLALLEENEESSSEIKKGETCALAKLMKEI
jgi:hypothetical protein